MTQTPHHIPPVRELIDTAALAPDELERLAHVDALLRAARPHLRLVATPERDEQTYALKLTFGELTLIYRSLQAAKTLGALPPQDELLDDTLQLVDQTLQGAI